MARYGLLLLLLPIIACSHWDKKEQTQRKSHAEVIEHQNMVEHMQFELELMELRGAKLCIPGQFIKLERIYDQALKEFQAGFYNDIDFTKIDFKHQRRLMTHQLQWIDRNTQCLLVQYSPSALQERFLLLMSVDNQFAEASTELLPEYQKALHFAARILKNQPEWHLSLIGFTDDIGSKTNNEALGMARAKAVKKYLTAQGVNPGKIDTFSEGEEYATGNTRTERLSNRQVLADLIVKDQKPIGERNHSIKDWNHNL